MLEKDPHLEDLPYGSRHERDRVNAEHEMAAELSQERGFVTKDPVVWSKDGCVYEFVELLEGDMALIRIPPNHETLDSDNHMVADSRKVPLREISHVNDAIDIHNLTYTKLL